MHPIETFEHSKKTAEKLAQLLSIPPPLAQKLITDKVTDSYHKFTNASGDDQANMVGEGVGDVLQIFVGSGEVKGLLQAVKIVKLADESIPVIKIIEEGAEAGGLAEDAAKSGTSVLGKFPDYLELASELEAKRFDIPPNIWNKMTEAERWVANTKFLDRMIARGDKIVLSNRVIDIKTVTGTFRKELDYLVGKGYRLSPDRFQMIK